MTQQVQTNVVSFEEAVIARLKARNACETKGRKKRPGPKKVRALTVGAKDAMLAMLGEKKRQEKEQSQGLE